MSNALYNFMHCLSFSYSTFFTFLSPSPLLKNTVNFVLLASAWIAASPSLLTLLISCSFSERQRTRGLVYILYGCVCLPYPSQGMCPVASVGSGVIHRGSPSSEAKALSFTSTSPSSLFSPSYRPCTRCVPSVKRKISHVCYVFFISYGRVLSVCRFNYLCDFL